MLKFISGELFIDIDFESLRSVMWIRIQRYKITDKMKGKAEFNLQTFFFFAGNYMFQVWTLKKSKVKSDLKIKFFFEF